MSSLQLLDFILRGFSMLIGVAYILYGLIVGGLISLIVGLLATGGKVGSRDVLRNLGVTLAIIAAGVCLIAGAYLQVSNTILIVACVVMAINLGYWLRQFIRRR